MYLSSAQLARMLGMKTSFLPSGTGAEAPKVASTPSFCLPKNLVAEALKLTKASR